MQEHQLVDFYHKYYKIAMKVAYNKVEDYYLAQDIVQEVFLKLFLKGGNLEENVVKPWLLVVTDHTAIDYRRKYCKKNIFSLMDTDLDEETECSMESLVMEEEQNLAFDCQSLQKKIFQGLARKNHVWYDIVVSLYVKDKTPEQVADQMGLTLPHMRTTLSRARKWIRKEYGTEFRELGL